MRSPAILVQTFHERGLRVTPQRERLFRILREEDGRHPTIEALYEAARREMPTISLKTVYQTVYALAELGEVQVLDLGTGSHRVEPTVEHPHHHLVCTGCGQVRDLFVDFPGLDLPRVQREGFRVDMAEVIFRGLCPDCAADPGKGGGPAGVRRNSRPSTDTALAPEQPGSSAMSHQKETPRKEKHRRV